MLRGMVGPRLSTGGRLSVTPDDERCSVSVGCEEEWLAPFSDAGFLDALSFLGLPLPSFVLSLLFIEGQRNGGE